LILPAFSLIRLPLPFGGRVGEGGLKNVQIFEHSTPSLALPLPGRGNLKYKTSKNRGGGK